MDVRSFPKGGVTVIELSGEINLASREELKKFFEKALTGKVVINLERVNYIDSSGLATLVEGLKKIRAEGGRLSLACASDKVKSLFTITKLDRLFTIHKNLQEAVDSVK